ncbi:TonB-dependent receptor [Sphingomonas cannabina]|uniref:TonB-dependent receptor n=1 Tax=Sphingomonas cannabina TaxID=2899123 RepID=UPI001F35D034|nr:TonB-dependent receptor [Sphingomonas cannabina]UIJ46357.1 TonB-dependent receptor [Sphingomonas cannabina]
MAATAAEAQTAARFRFSLPRQDLSLSLEAVATITRTNVIFVPSAARGRIAPALNGTYSAAEAVRRLLRGSGLDFTVTAGGSYVISKRASPPRREYRVAVIPEPAPVKIDDVADIVVTGSRIDVPGFEAPTPTSHITRMDLDVGARSNVAAALNDLPQFRGTISPQTSGTNTSAGMAPVDLRGLGINRTLVLLDGRRFSSDNDLNTVPTVLIKSVDVVTGGASAAWGSGAVAGVVNIVLDGELDGLKLGAQAGISSRGDAAEHRFESAFGTPFAGGRGHVILGAEYLGNDGIIPKTSRSSVGRWVSVSAGNGYFRLTPDVGFSNAAPGGLILSGVLAGQVFNPDGSLRDFRYGTVVGSDMIGGEGPSNDNLSALVTPQRRYSALGHVSFDATDAVKVTAELRHSRMWNDYIWFGDHNRGNIVISRDNAFLSPAISAQLLAAGEAGFTMGRFNSDFPFPRIDFERVTTQGTIALDGTIGKRWRWSGYYSHGEYRNDIDTPGFVIGANFNQAVDAVRDPATGQPICRVKLTDPSSACVPINLFGEGSPTAEALAYVTGTPRQRATTKLDVAGISLRGEPFTLWAGPVSIAAGIETRHEAIEQTVGELDLARAFRSFNFAPISGGFTVREAFGEILVPLARDRPLLRKLELNAAVRLSDYDTTGTIWSWKLGATNEVFPGFRARFTRSRDIRSANLAELFTQLTVGFNTLTDPEKGTSVYVPNNSSGNPDLRPETATTLTAGFLYAPPAISGLRLSLDYYRIRIDDVITLLSAQDLVTRCFNGNRALCAYVERDANGNITRTVTSYLNLSEYRTDGIDAELSQTLPLRTFADLPGTLTLRLLASWIDSLKVGDGVAAIEYVGSQGNSFSLGMPRWRINGSIGYDSDSFGAQLRARYISPGNFNSTVKLLNNHIRAYTYLDLLARVRVAASASAKMEVYGSVTNLLDKQAPNGSLYSPFYDVIGRYISIGARLAF